MILLNEFVFFQQLSHSVQHPQSMSSLRYHVPFWLFCHKSKHRKYLLVHRAYIYIYVHRKILNFNKTNPFEIKSLHLRFILEFVHPNSIAPSIHSTLAPSASPRSVRPLPLLLAAFWRRFSRRQSGPARWDHAEAWQRHPIERSWIARFAACWKSNITNSMVRGYESQKGLMSFFVISTWKKQTSLMDCPDFHAVGEFGSHKGSTSKVKNHPVYRTEHIYHVPMCKNKTHTVICIPYTSIFSFYSNKYKYIYTLYNLQVFILKKKNLMMSTEQRFHLPSAPNEDFLFTLTTNQ